MQPLSQAAAAGDVRDEIFTKLCSASVRDTGVSTAVAPLTHLLEASQASSWQAAAFLAHAVTQVLVACGDLSAGQRCSRCIGPGGWASACGPAHGACPCHGRALAWCGILYSLQTAPAAGCSARACLGPDEASRQQPPSLAWPSSLMAPVLGVHHAWVFCRCQAALKLKMQWCSMAALQSEA